MSSHNLFYALLVILCTILSSTRGEDKKLKHRGLLPQLKKSQPPAGAIPAAPGVPRAGAPYSDTSGLSFDKNSVVMPEFRLKNKAVAQANCTTTHSIESWMHVTHQHSPAATSSGVYFISNIRDLPQIFHLSSPKSWPTQISYAEGGVHQFQVSPDEKQIAYTSQMAGDEQYDLYLWENHATRPLIVDREKRIESFRWAHDSKGIYFTSNARNKIDMDLYFWDVKKNSHELLIPMEGSNTINDISLDKKWAVINRFRSVTDSELFLVNLEKKQITPLIETKTQRSIIQGLFTQNSKGIFYLSDENTGHSQVYFSKLDSLNQRKLITSGVGEVEEIFLDPPRERLVVHKNIDGYSILEGMFLDSSGNRRNLLSLPKLNHVVLQGLSFSPDKKSPTLFFSQTSSRFPAEIFSWKSESITQWTNTSEGLIKTPCLRSEELVFFPTSDGKKIPAFLYLPHSKLLNAPKDSKPIPFIVYIHGGPESQFRPGFNKIFQYFLERGYGVFAPNVRGSTGYGRDYTLLDNYKLRMDSVRDAIEGSQWLIQQRLAQKGKLGVYGGSYGGFMVLAMIENAPDLFSAASESVGISNFVSFLKNTKDYRRKLREVEYGPLSDEPFLESISPIHQIEKIKTPLLIFHGANDPRVPVSETEQIVEALKKKEVPVESKIFSDEGHGNLKLKNILEQARWMVNFFEHHFQKDKKEGVSSSLEETP